MVQQKEICRGRATLVQLDQDTQRRKIAGKSREQRLTALETLALPARPLLDEGALPQALSDPELERGNTATDARQPPETPN